jgi:site-specific recombinase XerD
MEANRISEKAGLTRIRFHDLRHAHATILVENGADIKVVDERLRSLNNKNDTRHLYLRSKRQTKRSCRVVKQGNV